MGDGKCAELHERNVDARGAACRVRARVRSDELQNSGGARRGPSPGYLVSVASKGDQVEQKEHLQKC